MAISNEKRQEVLLDSFDTLKDEFKDNSEEIQDIIVQISNFNPELSLKMWRYEIEINEESIKLNKEKYGWVDELLSDMLSKLYDQKQFETMEKMVLQDKTITNALFCYSPYVYSLTHFVGNAIKRNQLNDANRLIDILYNNNKIAMKDTSFAEFLQGLIEKNLLQDQINGSCFFRTHNSKEYSEDVQDLLRYWIDKLDAKDKAKLNISFIKIC